MTAETRREIGEYLVGHIDVIEDAALYEALEAWSAMRDQRDQARRELAELAEEHRAALRIIAQSFGRHCPGCKYGAP